MTSFATLEQRAVRAAVRRASNATAEWLPGGGASPVVGIRLVFDRQAGGRMDGMVNDREPVASVCEADMPSAARGQALRVAPDAHAANPVALVLEYEISCAEPDGAGLLVLALLEKVL
jgi:hypothetical protein